MTKIEPRKLHPVQGPLVRIASIERMLNNHVEYPSAESRLVVAVICQAFVDCTTGSEKLRERERSFFFDGRLDMYASLIGISANFVREVATKTRYLQSAPTKRAPFVKPQPLARTRARPTTTPSKKGGVHA